MTTSATRYRKRPVTIDAIQFVDAPSADRIRAAFGDAIRFDIGCLLIDTLEGQMRAELGDWIVRGVRGECYPVKPDIFAETYEPATPQPADRAALRDRIEVWPLARVLTEVQCGSQDWSWEEEWADLDRRHAETGYLTELEQQIRQNGITMPVLIGSDGRLWDGHHRLRIAVRLGIGYVPVELTPPADMVLPEPADRAAVLREAADEIANAFGDPMAKHVGIIAASWLRRRARDIEPGKLRRMADEGQQDGGRS